MYLFGEDMSLVDSNANYVGDAFSKLDFFVVQEIFFSDTCRYADVILPASPSLEKEGTLPHRATNPEALSSVRAIAREAGPTGKSSRTSPIVSGQDGTTSILPRFIAKSLR